jgi:hypothetical protein
LEERTTTAASPESVAEKLVTCLLALGFAAALVADSALAAEFRPAPHEVWSGTYQCDAIERDPVQWPAYSATVRLVLDDGVARIVKESARIRETMSGKVSDNGAVSLEGAGVWKGGSGTQWRYRFDGQFRGSGFEAQGVMLSSAMATKLRACSMKLTRVHALRTPQEAMRAVPAKAKPAQALEPAIARAQAALTPSRPEESLQVNAVADTSAAGAPRAAQQSAGKAVEVTKTTSTPTTERAVTQPVSERPAASGSGWSLKAGWLVLFAVLAAIAALVDRYLLK